MDNETYASLEKVVEYLWIDEEKHFEESDHPKDHIFRDIKRLRDWVKETAKEHDND
jgi:hypothetical protein